MLQRIKTNVTKIGILRCWSAGRLNDAAFDTPLMSLMYHSVQQDRTVPIHLKDFNIWCEIGEYNVANSCEKSWPAV